LEDLLPFSDETLVRAVHACTTPVVSAIGHETDTPILDLVADLRASTPTDAAKRVVPDAAAEAAGLLQAIGRLRRALVTRIETDQRQLAQLRSRPALKDPTASIEAHRERLESSRQRLRRAVEARLREESGQVRHNLERVRAMSPRATLQRGYAIVSRGHETVGVIADVTRGDSVNVQLIDGRLTAAITAVEPQEMP
ncbi:MAG: exodeoxyribonuclease VII large subunit, partial [Propionicimonas sp.]